MGIRTALLATLWSLIAMAGWEGPGRYSFQSFPHPKAHSLSLAPGLTLDGAGGFFYFNQGRIGRFDGRDYQVLGAGFGLPGDQVVDLAFLEWDAGNWCFFWGHGWYELLPTGAVRRTSIPDLSPQQAFFSVRDGGLACLTAGGLVIHPPRGGKPIRFPPPPDGYWARGLLEGTPARLHLLGDRGLATWGGGAWSIRALHPQVKGHPFDLLRDRKGALWIRSDQDLVRLEPGPVRSLARELQLGRAETTQLHLDPFGRVWTHDAMGLAWTDGNRTGRIRSEEGLEGMQAFWPMVFDSEGALWTIGSGGLQRLRGGFRWTFYDHRQGLPAALIHAIHRATPEAPLYIGTGAGLARSRPRGGFEAVPNSQGWQIYALASDERGFLWGGGTAAWYKDSPFFRVHPNGRFEPVQVTGGPIIQVTSLAPRGHGTFWVGSTQGLWLLETGNRPRRVQPSDLPEGLRSQPVFFVQTTPDQRPWASTLDGLWTHAGGRWERVLRSEGKFRVTGIVQVAPQRYWLASREEASLRQLTWTESGGWDTQKGLGSHPLEDIRPLGGKMDAKGNVWFNCQDGVRQFKDGKVIHHGFASGLPSEDLGEQGMFGDGDGSLWVPTSGGLARFQPAFDRGHPPLPSLVLHLESAAPPGFRDGGVLSERPGPVSFQLRHPHQDGSEGWKVQARLLGAEEAWREVAGGQLRFPLLPAGTYRLEARIQSPEGTFGPLASFSFRILAPWYFRWPMLLLDGSLVLALIAWAVRFRLRRMEAERLRLESLVQARTDDLIKANGDLVQVLAEVRTLKGLVPICPYCKKIRDDGGAWKQLEEVLTQHTEAQFSHGVCPDCVPVMRRELFGGGR